MTQQQKIDEVRSVMAQSGLWIVGDEIWPYDEFHFMVAASTQSTIDPEALAALISSRTGVICAALPKNQATPNIYNFVSYRATPTATITTPLGEVLADVHPSDVEDAMADQGIRLVAVYAYPVASDIDSAEALVDAAQAFVKPFDNVEVPILLADNEVVLPHTWMWLRVSPVGIPPLDTGTVKALLEGQGYKVIAPDKGISRFFADSEDYVTPDGTYVVFNPGEQMDVSAGLLRTSVFAELGDLYPTFFTTLELAASQSAMDAFYAFQSVEEGIVGAGSGAVELTKNMLSMLQHIMRVLPAVLWLALGGAVAFLGWNIYKHIKEERDRPSILRRRARR